jgi:hypothetical protein
MLTFKPENHSYSSDDGLKWTSVTTLIGAYKEHFDAKTIAKKCSVNKKSKWFGIEPEQIEHIWNAEAERSCTLGEFYHKERETDVLSCDTLTKYGKELPIIHPIENEAGVKIAPEQRLKDGIYPEHFVYLKSAAICGQADLVEVVDNVVNISDYKTNKKIDLTSFTNWEGISKKLLPPLQHLPDCNFYHYALQLSLYMYIILRHNPNLKPGKLVLHHVKFEECDQLDEHGFPIITLENGHPIVKNITCYEVPYLKDEVINLINSKKW